MVGPNHGCRQTAGRRFEVSDMFAFGRQLGGEDIDDYHRTFLALGCDFGTEFLLIKSASEMPASLAFVALTTAIPSKTF